MISRVTVDEIIAAPVATPPNVAPTLAPSAEIDWSGNKAWNLVVAMQEERNIPAAIEMLRIFFASVQQRPPLPGSGDRT